MRFVRIGHGPSAVSADIRAALSAWGAGCDVFGGVAVLGCQPPGCPHPVDAVLVLPRGIIVLVGADLPEPALKLDAPLNAAWKVDGWPLVRSQGAVNPALAAARTASALAQTLQARGIELAAVGTIVAVGPYVSRIDQPAHDLDPGVRVLFPSTTSVLAAARELATQPRVRTAEEAGRLLETLAGRAGRMERAELLEEGFSSATRNVSSAPLAPAPATRSPGKTLAVTIALAALLCGVVALFAHAL